jgi:hypothetical protein
MTKEQQEAFDDWSFKIPFEINKDPTTLIETIDYIKCLRRLADEEASGMNYDPHGYTEEGVAAFRAKADELEAAMEERLGWR